jgi:hypothetical protein
MSKNYTDSQMTDPWIAGEDHNLPQPLRTEDGRLEQFMFRNYQLSGQSFYCECGCNVFHRPDHKNLDLYQCNCCERQFEAYDE